MYAGRPTRSARLQIQKIKRKHTQNPKYHDQNPYYDLLAPRNCRLMWRIVLSTGQILKDQVTFGCLIVAFREELCSKQVPGGQYLYSACVSGIAGRASTVVV